MSNEHIQQAARENAEFIQCNRQSIEQLLDHKLSGAELESITGTLDGRSFDRQRIREIAWNHGVSL